MKVEVLIYRFTEGVWSVSMFELKCGSGATSEQVSGAEHWKQRNLLTLRPSINQ